MVESSYARERTVRQDNVSRSRSGKKHFKTEGDSGLYCKGCSVFEVEFITTLDQFTELSSVRKN
jgi:hypothetical protein